MNYSQYFAFSDTSSVGILVHVVIPRIKITASARLSRETVLTFVFIDPIRVSTNLNGYFSPAIVCDIGFMTRKSVYGSFDIVLDMLQKYADFFF